ncbi:9542_t:CDS:1, partial [Paraglomus occultum]
PLTGREDYYCAVLNSGCIGLGILDTHYQAADLEAIEAAYDGLYGITKTTISLTVLIGDKA